MTQRILEWGLNGRLVGIPVGSSPRLANQQGLPGQGLGVTKGRVKGEVLDSKVEYGDLDAENPGCAAVHSTELSLMESNSNFNPPTRLKWKSVEEILQWRTNSWVWLPAEI